MFPSESRRVRDANLVLSPFTMAELSDVAAARGDPVTAAGLRIRVLERLDRPDRPVPALEDVTRRIRDALAAEPVRR